MSPYSESVSPKKDISLNATAYVECALPPPMDTSGPRCLEEDIFKFIVSEIQGVPSYDALDTKQGHGTLLVMNISLCFFL